jgi:thiol:disulfide interchange protein DsbD
MRSIYNKLGIFAIAIGTFFACQQPSKPISEVTPEKSADSLKPPFKWIFEIDSYDSVKLNLVATATIDSGWALFSSTMKDDEPNTRLILDSGVKIAAPFIYELSGPTYENNALLGIPVSYFQRHAVFSISFQIDSLPIFVSGNLTSMAFKGDEFTNPIPTPFRFKIDSNRVATLLAGGLQVSETSNALVKRTSIQLDQPVAACGGTGTEGSKGLLRIFFLGLLGGLLALIMPCTFPMIPMTVSFFTKRTADKAKGIKNAFLYGFFIFIIYVLLSVPFYFLESGNASILNNISTNAWLNLGFAAVFFVFALSFFGLFEITLPGEMANKVDSKSSLGSVGGIFFMALTLAIVSFSCTGPILGTLLVGALNENGGAMQLTVAMSGFGLALGLPFGLFALFPGWLSTLPRSGSWMNTVKIVFAFIELALMLKFLSNADLVMHWGLLKREVFIGLWILIGAATSLYLLGILKFKHDPPPAVISKTRKYFAAVFAVFSLYLVPGLTNTPYAHLSLISGFPPPMTYSLYHQEENKASNAQSIVVVNDYFGALELSKKTGKPLLIDFTGWACVNCRKMEENVWTDPQVKKLIDGNFILVSLYVDDRKPLPLEQQFVYKLSDGSSIEIRTYGDLYAALQSENFKNASQPLYAIVNGNEKLMNRPVGYTPNATEYLNWLQCGLDAVGTAK